MPTAVRIVFSPPALEDSHAVPTISKRRRSTASRGESAMAAPSLSPEQTSTSPTLTRPRTFTGVCPRRATRACLADPRSMLPTTAGRVEIAAN